MVNSDSQPTVDQIIQSRTSLQKAKLSAQKSGIDLQDGKQPGTVTDMPQSNPLLPNNQVEEADIM